jgi:CO/xanthine dehydrogenase FAD-binding subunit
VGAADVDDVLLLLEAAESLLARHRDAGLVRRLAAKATQSADPLSFIRAAKWILSF